MMPEKLLLGAVLYRAIVDACGPDSCLLGPEARSVIKRQATAWLLYWHDADRAAPFSYPWICRHLDVCPHELKRKILALIDSDTCPTYRECYIAALSQILDDDYSEAI